jgi:hypothetical protein
MIAGAGDRELDKGSMGSIESEKKTVEFMIRYYCGKVHTGTPLCGECADLLDYARRRLDACRYGDDKTSCRNCPTHCYPPEKREAVKKIMRYVGPGMIYLKPLQVLRHLFRPAGPTSR